MNNLPTWSYYLLTVLLAILLDLMFRWIFSMDTNPAQQQGNDYISLRMQAKVIEMVFMLAGSFLIMGGLYEFNQGNNKWIGAVTFGTTFVMITGFTVNTHLWLNEQGIHYRIGLGSVKSIAWSDLDHYEIQVSGAEGGSTYFYNFKSKTGATLSISRSNYEMNSLLAKISEHAKLQEQPYKSVSWLEN